MIKAIFSIALVGIMLLLSSCKIPLQPEIKGISEFKLNGKNNNKETGFAVGIDFFNPNAYKIKILSYDLNVFINGQSLGTASSRSKQIMLKQSTSTISFVLKADLIQLFKSLFVAIKGVLGDKQLVEVHIKGLVVGKARGIRKSIPIDFTKEVSLAD